jgi:hypothetical protein
VLASVGVLEKRRSPTEGLPGPNEELEGLLESEDTIGTAIYLMTYLTDHLYTWWIGIIRERILVGYHKSIWERLLIPSQTFRYHDVLSFGQIVASEHAYSGASMIYAGCASLYFAAINKHAIEHSALVYRPIDRLLDATHASRKTKGFFQRSRKVLKSRSVVYVTRSALAYITQSLFSS